MALPDYSIQTANPFASVMQGYAAGAGIREDQRKQQLEQLAQQQAVQQKQLLGQLASNPNATGDDYAKVITMIPGLAEPLTKAWAARSQAQNQSMTSDLLQWGAAIKNGAPNVAADAMNARAEAMENTAGAPTQESQALRANAQVILSHPELALGLIQAKLAANPSGKDAAATLASFGTEKRATDAAPSAIALTTAQGRKAAAEADVAESTVPEEVRKARLGNENTESVIADRVAQQRIADLNVQIGQADSETKRGQLMLERDKLMAEQNKTKAADSTGAQDAADSANALLAQINGVKNHPGLEAGTGTLSGIRSFFNSTDANDFRKAVEGLKSPVFLNELGKLKTAGVSLGQVTEAEGKKLEQRIANLDPDQSTPAFKNQLGVLMKDTEKFISKITASGKLPTTGGAVVVKSPVYGTVTEGQINKLLMQNPGSTREQALQFLQGKADPNQIPR